MSSQKGQNIVEYTVLAGVIVSALLIMQVYIKRCYSGRLKQEADSLGPQYSPKHTTSLITTVSNSNSTSYTGGTTSAGIPVPDGMSVTFTNTSTNFTRQEAVDAFATP